MKSAIDHAREYVQRGWRPIPIPAGEKGPKISSWQKLQLTESDLPGYFDDNCNIGVLLGEPSRGLIDIDLDHSLAVELADEFLPATAAVFGRDAKPRSHRLYRVVEPIATRKWQATGQGMIVELRSTGCQTVFPGSRHPSGEAIEWDSEGEPAQVDVETLLTAVDALAVEVRKRLGVPPDRSDARTTIPAVGGCPKQTPTKHDLDRARKYVAAIPGVSDGGRGDAGFRVAATLVNDFALDSTDARPILEEWNQRNSPPMDEGRVTSTLRSACKNSTGIPGSKLRKSTLPSATQSDDDSPEIPEGRRLHCPYRADPAGIVFVKPTRDGETEVPLTNFAAEIVADVSHDDGAEIRHTLKLCVTLNGRVSTVLVPASQFAAMSWVIEKLGAAAVIVPGFTNKDHCRAAIQLLSPNVECQTVYTHTGWRNVDGKWLYLHSGGAIGPDGPSGPVHVIETELHGSLARLKLPAPAVNDELVTAIRASLKLVELAPENISIPILCAVWRAPIGPSDCSIWLAGQTGTGKSELAALAQQHWGPELDARHLPANWSSTGNSLEGIAFCCKDALLVIDDFAPGGSTHDIARYHRDAERVLRAQGNSSGRARMRSDATLRPEKPPRGLILVTGEDVPRGHSIRARCLILEMGPGDLDWGALTQCQQDAATGRYAAALSGYIKWLAENYDEVQRNRPSRIEALRQLATTGGSHRRTPMIVAELVYGAELFCQFAVESGALSLPDTDKLKSRIWKALGEAAAAQDSHHAAVDPVSRFLELLISAIGSGKAHLAAIDGTSPVSPQTWGWQRRTIGTGDSLRLEWHAQGDRVGWVDGQELFLNFEAAFRAAQHATGTSGDTIPVSSRTLQKRLKERGLLTTSDAGRCSVRREVEGRQQRVIHLAASLLCADSGQSGPLGQEVQECGISDDDPWTDDPSRRDGSYCQEVISRVAVASTNGASQRLQAQNGEVGGGM